VRFGEQAPDVRIGDDRLSDDGTAALRAAQHRRKSGFRHVKRRVDQLRAVLKLSGMHFTGIDHRQASWGRQFARPAAPERLHTGVDDADHQLVMRMWRKGVPHESRRHQIDAAEHWGSAECRSVESALELGNGHGREVNIRQEI
jgi:hypothetical protein